MKPWKRPRSTPPQRGAKRFNGATAMKPWKSAAAIAAWSPSDLLQWGHGDEAVEERREEGHELGLSKLQWGHGDEAVEGYESRWAKY